MFMAKVTGKIAKRNPSKNLSPNHHARVWCWCQDNPVSEPGTYAGQHMTVQNDRTREQAANDPRRLGTYDPIGIVDLREENSAVMLFRKHVEESSRESAS